MEGKSVRSTSGDRIRSLWSDLEKNVESGLVEGRLVMETPARSVDMSDFRHLQMTIYDDSPPPRHGSMRKFGMNFETSDMELVNDFYDHHRNPDSVIAITSPDHVWNLVGDDCWELNAEIAGASGEPARYDVLAVWIDGFGTRL